MSSKGYSLMELITVTSLVSLILVLAFPHLKSYFAGNQITTGLRTITSALNTARYRAIKENRRIKFELTDKTIFLKVLGQDKEWAVLEKFTFSKDITLSINATPYFFPTGYISPLCSIIINNEHYKYKVTVSIAGRIKTQKLW